MSDAGWRTASAVDAGRLADLERDANLAALGHIFPAATHPFPYDEVLARWDAVVADAAVTVEVVGARGRLDAFLAYDGTTLRHLAVHPEQWGCGLARAGVERAEHAGAHRLWCLRENERARGLYEHLGWRPTGLSRTAQWAPYPLEIEYGAGRTDQRLTASQG